MWENTDKKNEFDTWCSECELGNLAQLTILKVNDGRESHLRPLFQFCLNALNTTDISTCIVHHNCKFIASFLTRHLEIKLK